MKHAKMNFLFLFILPSLLFLCLYGCKSDTGKKVEQEKPSPHALASKPVPSQAVPEPMPTIPPDVKITFIDINADKNIEKVFDIRLNKEVSEETLSIIANMLKKSDRREYERILINYYLPDMVPGKGAWATTHYNPELEVKILGLPKKE